MVCRKGLVILLALSSALSACGSLGIAHLPAVGNTINVVLELSPQVDLVEQAKLKALLEQEATEFNRLNPHLRVRWRSVSSERLHQDIKFRAARGLMPDLILLASSRDLLTLHQQGYSIPVELSLEEKRSLPAWLLSTLSSRGKQLGVPLFIVPTMACFDRRRIPFPPQELSDFLRPEDGSAMAFSTSLNGINWILSGFGVSLFPIPGLQSNRPSQVLPALRWVQQANLQPHITFVSSEEELRRGLVEGRFHWVSCSSAWIPSLRNSLGENLGVGLLPAGPAGVAKPLMVVSTWMFGAQSTPTQRRLAKKFVLFAGNAVNQRTMTLRLGTVLPVNPTILLPLNAYPTLSVMDASLRNSVLPNLEQYQYLKLKAERISFLFNQILARSQNPSGVAHEFQYLLENPPAAEAQP
jgi:maltose-binding protein MalE